MKKTNYIAVTIKEDSKYFSYCVKASSTQNLLSVLEIPNIITANICSTLKEAKQIVTGWNASYKRNGEYLFGDAPLF